MRLILLANEKQYEELLSLEVLPETDLVWVQQPEELLLLDPAEGCIDLLFKPSKTRVDLLNRLAPVCIVNSVVHTLETMDIPFIRMNAWPGFLNHEKIEASCNNDRLKPVADNIFKSLNRSAVWLPDQPGFITARVISMIINEAYFALEENISTRAEIDLAMKLGTNYPFGPFEWSNKIGIQNIYELLLTLSEIDPRYIPCRLLKQEYVDHGIHS